MRSKVVGKAHYAKWSRKLSLFVGNRYSYSTENEGVLYLMVNF